MFRLFDLPNRLIFLHIICCLPVVSNVYKINKGGYNIKKVQSSDCFYAKVKGHKRNNPNKYGQIFQ